MNTNEMTENETEQNLTANWPEWKETYYYLGRPPLEVMKWLMNARAALMNGPEAFANHLGSGGLGIEVEENCDCGDLRHMGDSLTWMHKNHRRYNRVARDLVQATIGIPAFKEILERDIEKNNELGPEWGEILRKDYAQGLIDNFADSTQWC